MADAAGRALPVLKDLPELPEEAEQEEQPEENLEPPDDDDEPTDEELFKRPDGVPEDWEAEPTKKGKGIIFTKTGTKGGTYVKIMRANPDSKNPGQRYDNVRVQINGKSKDIQGRNVPQKSLESHIPWDKFNFIRGLLK